MHRVNILMMRAAETLGRYYAEDIPIDDVWRKANDRFELYLAISNKLAKPVPRTRRRRRPWSAYSGSLEVNQARGLIYRVLDFRGFGAVRPRRVRALRGAPC